MNFNKFEIYGNPTLQQGGWGRTGADNDYIMYAPSDPNYNYRICTLEYVPQHHPTQMTITGIASKELEVSVLVLRSDNYIIAYLGWQENGYTFNLGSIYDKLGVMFRFKNGDTITPNLVSFDIIGGWHDTPHYIHKTDTDTITTLPAVLYPNGTTATVGLKGNMYQASGASPTTPIQPQETGERTGNLLNPANIMYDTTYDFNAGNFVSSDTSDCSGFIPVTAGTYLRIVNDTSFGNYYFQFDANKTPIRYGAPGAGMPMVIPDGVAYVVFNVDKSTGIDNVMFARTSTVISYEPYGIKIPILNGSQTTNVYLGEVQSTRRISKLVLTGDTNEYWNVETGTTFAHPIIAPETAYGDCICTHYKIATSYNECISTNNSFTVTKRPVLMINDNRFSSAADFKTYLAQQYANGTPVCVWYALATPETAVVNEPLRKIGDYADEVANVSIPVAAGGDTISVDTQVQPSEVSVNYKGWHPVQSVHEAENGQWD